MSSTVTPYSDPSGRLQGSGEVGQPCRQTEMYCQGGPLSKVSVEKEEIPTVKIKSERDLVKHKEEFLDMKLDSFMVKGDGELHGYTVTSLHKQASSLEKLHQRLAPMYLCRYDGSTWRH